MGLLHILQHSLGVDQYGQGEQYRNYFVTGEGSLDHPTCMEAVRHGLMVRRAGNALTDEMDVFHVTEAGRTYVSENSPAAPKLTASQRRYQRFLEHDSDLSFGEWLRTYGREAA